MKPNDLATKISGATALIRCLLEEQVEVMFGYPGGAIMPVYDALYDFQDQIAHILVRHEQGAVHAAQGYARASGKVGVAIATSGPGAANLLTGLADAMVDSTPLVCITGQVAKHLLGTDAFQEMDVINTTLPITKWNALVTDAASIPQVLAKAFYIARSGRPGPVLIDIAKNAQFETIEDFRYQACTHIRTYQPVPTLDVAAISQAAQLINQAERPYIVFGQGIGLADAGAELQALTHAGHIPMASTLLGLSAVPTDHEHYVGYLGMHGNYGPNILTNECDVLIALGMRFDDRVTGNPATYAKQAKVIHIDIDSAELNKIVTAEIAIHADVKQALQALIPQLAKRDRSAWFARFKAADAIEKHKVIDKEKSTTGTGIRMAEVIHEINAQTNGEAIIVTDVGQHQMVASRYAQFQKPRSCITSGGAGTMGFALPAAIGAKFAEPQRTVVAIIGDGGFQMTLQELGTIMQYGVAVKVLVLNNNFLGMVRQWQQLFFAKRYSFTEMDNPDFPAIAKAYRIDAHKVTERQALRSAIQHFLQHPNASFLEVVVEKEENVFPMVPSGAGVADVLLEPSETLA